MYLSHQVKNVYDVIVVGAGPAGSITAWQAARKGLNVLLLEKDREVGTPVRCAEGISKEQVENIIEEPLSPQWIAANINHFKVVSPKGVSLDVNVKETGCVLHRRLFDYDLALKAVRAGATLITNSEVYQVIKPNGSIKGVRTMIDEKEHEIHGHLVIAADGVESRVARWAGIDSSVTAKDMETCAQFTLADIEIDPHTCEFYFSREFAPGGYAWVFPKGEGTANVGLGVAGNFARKISPEEYLDIFLKKYFPAASIISKTIGGVPVARTLKELVIDNFMVVGDAAHQVNPISGGGITAGMIAGKIAGEIACEALNNGGATRKNLLPYARQWHRRIGKSHRRYYHLKEALTKFQDSTFDTIADEYSKLDQDHRNLFNLFKIAFKNHPTFLLDVVKLFY